MDYLPNFILLILFIFLATKEWNRKSNPKSKSQTVGPPKILPPEPWRLPVVGHLHHIISSLPHHAFRDLAKKYGPLMHLKLGQVSTIVVSSPEMAKEVLKTVCPACAGRPQSLASKIMWYDYVDIAFSPYGEYWRQMRKICILELLSVKNVRSFENIRKDEASRLIGWVRSNSGKTINLTEKTFMFTSAVTCRAAFGKMLKDRETLIGYIKEAVVMAGGFDMADLFPSVKMLAILNWNRFKLLKMRRKMDSILDSLIDEHKQNQDQAMGNGEFSNEDLVDVLLRLQRSGDFKFPITQDNIKAVIFDMFSAGTETSSTTLDWAMAELMKNPRVLAKLQAEVRKAFKGKETIDEAEIRDLKYLKLVIKETLRMHPAVPMVPRACREECEVNGYTIPVNAKVLINSWGLGRDPNYWVAPETFMPERFEDSSIDFFGGHFEYLPFGSGRRICPGMNFGLAAVELPLAQLLYHFDWELPDGVKPCDLDMTEAEGIAVGRKQNLVVVATPHEDDPST
ncbi:premnaspirodiene oxygenase-like [Andrographis paniculata]|uniref:premnaspirodiene oxygenase-like n=1 Tax=Andrographis paniculata TaxID=175694 RepID=UPI0021E99556|nr:premnaspirodiene oxygenase-like [Andrographis paniculata]